VTEREPGGGTTVRQRGWWHRWLFRPLGTPSGGPAAQRPPGQSPGGQPPARQQSPGRGRTRRQRDRPLVGRVWRAYAYAVVALRYPVLAGWAVAAVAATVYLPGLAPSSALTALIPSGAAAVRAEADSVRQFGLPLSAPAETVQRDPHGFSVPAQERAVRQAVAVDSQQATGIPRLAGALPVANTGGLFPGSREQSTTIVTFLFFQPSASVGDEAAGAEAYAHRYLSAPQDHLVGVTGVAPGQDEQSSLVLRYLPFVEAATLAAIALIVGLYFRSLGAPLATLACAGVAYLVAVRVAAWAAQRFGVAVAPDLEPVLVVLLLGVTTDYSVFFLAGMRNRLAEGHGRTSAARLTTAEFTPIIVTAGLVVGGGIASMAVARLAALRAFGPVLAAAVLIAMLVAVTLAPAFIAIFGRLLFLPGPGWFRRALAGGGTPGRDQTGLSGQAAARGLAGGEAGPGDQSGRVAADGGQQRDRRRWAGGGRGRPRGRVAGPVWTWRESAARVATNRAAALLIAGVCAAALVFAALAARDMRLGYPLIRALPAGSEASQAQMAAAKGFVPGILAPTEVLVIGPHVTGQRAALSRLEHELARRKGVAGVIGPADLPPGLPSQQAAQLLLARSGGAARFAVIERTDPLGPAAIGAVRSLRQALPSMARAAGLTGVRVETGGETALAGEAIEATQSDLARIAPAIAAVIFLLLAVFLRALGAPVYLLAASVLAVLSALGLTVWIFQGILGYSGLVYYVPFAAAVLLVSLGSDYNVFVVGRIFQEARRLPLRDAVALAVPRASRAITVAGLALAAGFALLALVPLDQFRELAVAMVLGIVIDTFVVRSLLVPALVVLFGRAGRWPHCRTAEPS
jgi:putative drug exporter of the RND superfamily